MPAAPEAASSIALRRPACDSDPVSNVTVVAFSAPPSWPANRKVTEHVGDRPKMLLRKHFGRCEQRRLPAGVDDREHRAQRNDRLAGADFALQEAMHRMVGRNLGSNQFADAALTVREFERQSRIEGSEQSVIDRTSRGGRQSGSGHPALGQHDLQDEGLVPGEATASPVSLIEGLRSMDSFECLSVSDEPELVANLLRHWVFGQIERVEHQPACSDESSTVSASLTPG